MSPIHRIRSRTVVLPANDVDTDQIIPARFLTTTSREGFGRALFADWRLDAEGRPRPEFALNRPEAVGCSILVGGHNFGCGSSREHAPWALLDFGIRAVISTSFADIFRSNALKNGLLPVALDHATHEWLMAHPGVEVEIDLASATVALPDGRRAEFPVEPFARYCLLHGVDELGYLLSQQPAIESFERRRAR
ncbi:MAG: 3-isopropylmalate dehydratase small subunit [Steroidobacteraceae bacterium]